MHAVAALFGRWSSLQVAGKKSGHAVDDQNLSERDVNGERKKNGHLPEDVMVEVLARLPVKSILRLGCVCRRWLSLFSQPYFIDAHLKYSRPAPDHPVLGEVSWFLGSTKNHEVGSVGSSCDHQIDIDKLVPLCGKLGQFVGTCNGLFCMVCEPSHNLEEVDDEAVTSPQIYFPLYVWNPSTKVSRQLPLPHTPSHGSNSVWDETKLGFGYDQSSDDYKVVKFDTYFVHTTTEVDVEVHEVEVFSLKANSWRGVPGPFPQFHIEPFSGYIGRLFGGCLNWLVWGEPGTDRDRDSGVPSIASFDLATEKFRMLPLIFPALQTNPTVHSLSMGVLVGYLSITHIRSVSSGRILVDVWIMKEYGVESSWTLVAAAVDRHVDTICYQRHLYFSTDVAVAFIVPLWGGGLLHLMKQKSVAIPNTSSSHRHQCCSFAGLHVESLVSPHGNGRDDKDVPPEEAIDGET